MSGLFLESPFSKKKSQKVKLKTCWFLAKSLALKSLEYFFKGKIGGRRWGFLIWVTYNHLLKQISDLFKAKGKKIVYQYHLSLFLTAKNSKKNFPRGRKPREWKQTSALCEAFGTPISISHPKRPDLLKAGSMASTLFVIPIMTTLEVEDSWGENFIYLWNWAWIGG